MNKTNILIFITIFLSLFSLCGCGDKDLPSAKITRDDLRTGGSLSFVYDSDQREIFVGGEDEVVQYSSADESKGLEAGCRVGLKVTAPDETLDLTNATLEMNGINYSAGTFLESVNGQLQRFFNIYPLVSKDNITIKFSVVWQDGTKEQNYTLKIVDGTKFMDKDGNIE